MRSFELTNRRLIVLAALVALVWSAIFVERALMLLAERRPAETQPITPVAQPAPSERLIPPVRIHGGVALG